MLDPRLILLVGGSTLAVIGLGTAYKISSLRGGGPAVAEQLGGRLLHPNTDDADERRVLNVVSEMSIASGVPCPPVYMMADETSINAFAAGNSPEDAAIGVTRGCVQKLNRDELQGVMAHEFSHILNGDMRLNLRLMGLIHGILVLGILGTVLLRSGAYGGLAAGGGRRDSGRGGAAVIILIGGAVMVIGFVGTFFGNLIKASVSRQREYLADASAVQFTRNPQGIGNALRRIGEGSSVGDRPAGPGLSPRGRREEGGEEGEVGSAPP